MRPTELQASTVFPDTENHPYKTSIEFLYNRGVVEGYPDGNFKPYQSVNRAEIMKIILEASLGQGTDIGSKANCFSDVRSDWFARYVCYARDNGIVEGYSDGRFRPEQLINIAEALKMGVESFDIQATAPSGTPWYQGYLNFVHDNNVFSKYSLRPAKEMTRGEMAYLIHQLMLNKEGVQTFTGVRNSLSPGCGETPPKSAPTSSVISGVTRHYITVVPSSYDKNTPLNLIFAFHGRTNPNTMVRTYYKVEEASKGQAIMIYPAGLPEGGPTRSWSDPGDKADNLRDYALFDQLLDEFSNNYCINLDEVYITSHSLGAWFTNSLACFRGDKIRAIGSLGGGTTIGECAGPVAAMIWHNPSDRLAPFSSGVTARDQLLRQNGCGLTTVPTEPSAGNCVEYTDCPKGSPVVWCPHTVDYAYGGTYYPHTWPNFTGSEMWKFFKSL